MYYRIVILSLLSLLSCRKKENFDAIQIIGHAGNGLNSSASIYHDNSKEAIDLALTTEGCEGVEVDVQLSKNGELWLYHDPQLQSESNLSGCINSINGIENAYYKTSLKEQLVRLNELSTAYLKGKTIFLDLRYYNECEDKIVDLEVMIQQLKAFQQTYSSTNIYVMTNYEAWVEALYLQNFQVIFSAETLDIAAAINQNQVVGFMFKNQAISKSDVEYYQAQNKKIIIFEVRSPKGIRSALRKYPDFLVTDDIRTTLIEKYP